MNSVDLEFELSTRIGFAKGQIMEALGDLAKVSKFPATASHFPEIAHAERALRYAIAELNGTARAGESHWPPPCAAS